MGLLEALENFADNLPHALDDLKGLREDFKKTFGPLAREGAELFTVGFEEMVIKDNNNWKSSYDLLAEAWQLVAVAREASASYPNLAAAIDQLRETINAFEKEQGECWEATYELLELLNPSSITTSWIENPSAGGMLWQKMLRGMLSGAPGPIGLDVDQLAETLANKSYSQSLREKGLPGPLNIAYAPEDACSRNAILRDREAAAREYAAAQSIVADEKSIAVYIQEEAGKLIALASDFDVCATHLASIRKEWMSASNQIENMRNREEKPANDVVQGLRQRSADVKVLLQSPIFDHDSSTVRAIYKEQLERLCCQEA